MEISKNAVAGGVAALGGTSAVVGVVIANQNKETIEDRLKNDLLPTTEGFENEWDKKVSELTNVNDESQLIHGLKEIKTTSKNKKTSLQKWCNENSKEQSSNEELLNVVKKWCVFTIKQKIGEELSFLSNDSKDEADIKSLVKELKASDSSETLPQELSIIKNDSGEKWEDLRTWCQQSYERGYRGETDSLWNLTNKYCKKPTIFKKLNNLQLPSEGVDQDWNTQAGKAETQSKDESLKTRIKAATAQSTNKGDVLKKWCQDQYTKIHDSKLNDNEKTPIFEEVKKWCVLLIKDKLESSEKMNLESADDADGKWKEKSKTLRSYQETDSGSFSLPGDLKAIKEDMDSEGANWSQLKEWCKKAYDAPYKGASDTIWKSVEKFCKED